MFCVQVYWNGSRENVPEKIDKTLSELLVATKKRRDNNSNNRMNEAVSFMQNVTIDYLEQGSSSSFIFVVFFFLLGLRLTAKRDEL